MSATGWDYFFLAVALVAFGLALYNTAAAKAEERRERRERMALVAIREMELDGERRAVAALIKRWEER